MARLPATWPTEPPNSRWKLPTLIVFIPICVGFAFIGLPVLWAVLGVICAVEIGFVLAGRNPWWMQGWRERQANTAPEGH